MTDGDQRPDMARSLEEVAAGVRAVVRLAHEALDVHQAHGPGALWRVPQPDGELCTVNVMTALYLMQAVTDALGVYGPLDDPPFGNPDLKRGTRP